MQQLMWIYFTAGNVRSGNKINDMKYIENVCGMTTIKVIVIHN